MRNAFAKALRKMRKARGLTQEDFALVSSRTYLSSLERGKKSPTLDKICDLSRILPVHPLSLFTLACLYFDDGYDIDSLFARVKAELQRHRTDLPMIRVLITDDHTIVREGLKQLFNLSDDILVVSEATNGEQAMARLSAGGVDVLLLDMSMPGLCGRELITLIRERFPDLAILVFSMHIEPQIARSALEAGANGYLVKDQDPEILLDAIRTVATGGSFVDPRHLSTSADCVP